MALTEDTVRDYSGPVLQDDLPSKAAVEHFEGGAVGSSAGYARPLVAGDSFLGFSLRGCDNSDGGDGDKRVSVATKGKIRLPVAGVDGPDDVNTTVYASADGTFTTTAGGNSSIGKVARHEGDDDETICMVAFEAVQERSL